MSGVPLLNEPFAMKSWRDAGVVPKRAAWGSRASRGCRPRREHAARSQTEEAVRVGRIHRPPWASKAIPSALSSSGLLTTSGAPAHRSSDGDAHDAAGVGDAEFRPSPRKAMPLAPRPLAVPGFGRAFCSQALTALPAAGRARQTAPSYCR